MFIKNKSYAMLLCHMKNKYYTKIVILSLRHKIEIMSLRHLKNNYHITIRYCVFKT